MAMRLMNRSFRSACFLPFLSILFCVGDSVAAEKLAAVVFVKDGLTVANQPVTIEARLLSKGLLSQSGLGGEPLELVVHDTVVGTAMTGGDGKAKLTYTPKAQGILPIVVRVGQSPRVGPAEGQANLAVWERRSPIVAVETTALIDEPSVQGPLPGGGISLESGPTPLPDAADELAKLTQFYYHVIYVVSTGAGADGFRASAETRDWLRAHTFPAGYVLVLPLGEQAVGRAIDELHAAGWKTVKTGIGRSKGFAEAFLQRRLDAVMVPEPKKGDAPRKAKVAKDWKEIRKKL